MKCVTKFLRAQLLLVVSMRGRRAKQMQKPKRTSKEKERIIDMRFD